MMNERDRVDNKNRNGGSAGNDDITGGEISNGQFTLILSVEKTKITKNTPRTKYMWELTSKLFVLSANTHVGLEWETDFVA